MQNMLRTAAPGLLAAGAIILFVVILGYGSRFLAPFLYDRR